jgi:hypothetical protein
MTIVNISILSTFMMNKIGADFETQKRKHEGSLPR